MHSIEHSGECCHPNCDWPVSEKLSSPLCDRHSQNVYLAVKSLVDNLSPEAKVASQGYSNRPQSANYEQGLVYFINKRGLIKIGFTTDLRGRVRGLGCRLEDVVGTMPGTMQDEKILHARFRHLCVGGEWFRIAPELVAFIGALWVEAA